MVDHSESYQASRRRRMLVPALPPYLIEPIWTQFAALLPEREVSHPLGCHRPRIPDRLVFEKLVQVLVFGCAYERIADASCSATTLARPPRRVDRVGGDGAAPGDGTRRLRPPRRPGALGGGRRRLHNQGALRGREGGQEPGGPREDGHQTLDGGRRFGHPAGRGLGAGQPPRLPALGPDLGGGVRGARRSAARRGERPPRPRLRLASHPRAASGPGLAVGDLGEGQAGAFLGHEEVGGGADGLVAQRPQEAPLVHGACGEGGGLLDGVLRGGDYRQETHPRRMETLPMGGSAFPTAVTYPRSLL